MKDNYDIKRHLDEPSPEAIRKHQDFDALMESFQEYPTPPIEKAKGISLKRSYIFAMASTLGIICLAGIWYLQTRGSNTPNLALQKPLPGLLLDADKHLADATNADTILRPNGSKIIIPAQAFAYANGEVVQGEVEIAIQEYHDVAELFQSGVNMQVADNEYLESAGMIHIEGYQNGEKVQIRPGKSLSVHLYSHVDQSTNTDNFNAYILDSSQNQWSVQGPDLISSHTVSQRLADWKPGTSPSQTRALAKVWTAELEQKIGLAKQAPRASKGNSNQPTAVKPMKPNLLNRDRFHFKLDVLPSEYPELSAMGDIIWEVSGEGFKDEWYDMEWTDIQLNKLPNGSYYATLVGNGLRIEMDVLPVSTQTEYNKAMVKYQKLLSEYNKTLSEPNSSESYDDTVVEALQAELALTREIAKAGSMRKKVLNVFSVSQFGYWMCGKKHRIDQNLSQLNVRKADGKALNSEKVYLANFQKNCVYQFSSSQAAQVQASAWHSVWTVEQQQNIAQKLLGSTENTDTLKLGESQPVANMEDLRRLILGSN
jgi:hypothetical protein